MSVDTDEKVLIDRAASGERAAFDALYARHVRPVYWQAYALLNDPDDAEEVTQDVFVTAWRKLHGIDIVGGSLLPWLLVTTRYTAANKRRARKRHAHASAPLDETLADPRAEVDAQIEAGEVLTLVRKAIDELSGVDQDLFALCITEGKTYEEAAETLGVSHGTVRNRLSRIRRRLRADLRALRGVA